MRERPDDPACTDAGLPAPDFVELAGFRVVLPTEPTSVSAVSGDDRTLLDLLGDRGRSTAELAAELGRSTRAVRTRLARLVDRGLVVEIGSSPHDPHRRYHRGAGSSA